MLVVAALTDGLVRPRAALWLRSAFGFWLNALATTVIFGLFLALSGNTLVSACLALAVLALLVLVSNAKHAMLGEPLLFSDLALVRAIVRHPQFYLSAVTLWQRVIVAVVAMVLLGTMVYLFVPSLEPHIVGIVLFLGGLSGVKFSSDAGWFRRIAPFPAAYDDVRRHGFLPVLILYWFRWRESYDPPPCPELTRKPLEGGAAVPELVIVIQCESFADPVELFADANLALPALSAARSDAWQCGNLMVSGFGAYTMRTEYGVIFGRDENALGFRCYDPFLTALGEATYGLPAQLKSAGWRSVFVHPHDMRFYGRDRIMPAAGFEELVGEKEFTAPIMGAGRYVSDAAVAEKILELAASATKPTLIYGVTIENHGPWAPDDHDKDLVKSYLRLVARGDSMLEALRAQIRELQRPALLVFFGDHRPSIPGATAPGGDRHTPYVIVRYDEEGAVVRGESLRRDLSPGQLHHTLLDLVLGNPNLDFFSRKAP